MPLIFTRDRLTDIAADIKAAGLEDMEMALARAEAAKASSLALELTADQTGPDGRLQACLEGSDLTLYVSVTGDRRLSAGLVDKGELDDYIEKHMDYRWRRAEKRRIREEAGRLSQVNYRRCCKDYLESVEEDFPEPEPSFADQLLELIDRRGLKDSEAYRRSNIDRRLFSKIRNNPAYTPKKNTVLAFAVGLGLDLEETKTLLMKAGYAFSDAVKSDIIVKYCIEHGNYSVYEVNQILFDYGQDLLGQTV